MSRLERGVARGAEWRNACSQYPPLIDTKPVVTDPGHPKARSGRRNRRSLRAASVLALAGSMASFAVVGTARPASADDLANARAEATQLASQIQAQGEQLAASAERYDQAQIKLQQLDQQVAQ